MKKLSFIFSALFVACSKPADSKKVLWFGGSGDLSKSEAPKIEAPFQKGASSFKVGQESVVIERQVVDQVTVESSYIKKIQNANDQTVFVNANYENDISLNLQNRLKKMKALAAGDWVRKLQQEKPFLKDKKLVEDPELAIRVVSGKLEPVIKFNFIENNEQVQSWVFDSHFQLLTVESVGSHFIQAKALVYPEGPKLTNLTSVFLKSLIEENTGLITNQVKVTTESNQKVSFNENLNFNPPDERFDQVQVFYYLQKAITWFEDKLNIEKNKMTVNAVTYVGFPEKTNAAFYYKGTIRLGAGDDTAFSHIAYDPSIVMHEASHGVIEMLAGLPYQNEGGSLNEGFADFLTCTILENSKLGEVAYKKAAFKRDISQVVKFSEKNSGLYHDSAIVSSYFWAVKEKIGSDKTIKLAISVLKKLNPFSDLNEFKTILNKVILDDLSEVDQKEALNILKSRD